MTKKKLNESHRLVAEEYVRNGGKGIDAYLTVYRPPTLKRENAYKEASLILARPEVKEYLDKIHTDIRYRLGLDGASLLQIAKRLLTGAESKEKYQAAVCALNEINKMTGNYAPSKVEQTSTHEIKITELKMPDNHRSLPEKIEDTIVHTL